METIAKTIYQSINQRVMEELYNNIQAKMIEFSADLNLNVNKGNKSAGVRARKASLELEKMFKEYRKQSLNILKK